MRTELNEIVKKNRQLDKIIVADYIRVSKDYLKYKEDLNLFQWTIDSEKKIINDYPCQKATTRFSGRDYTAWFTGEIPISDGPYKFNGLPGLIIELYDTDDHYHYLLTSLKRAKTPYVIYLENELDCLGGTKDYFDVDKQKFFQLKREAHKNFFRDLENRRGITIGMNNEEKRKTIEYSLDETDNPIELIEF